MLSDSSALTLSTAYKLQRCLIDNQLRTIALAYVQRSGTPTLTYPQTFQLEAMSTNSILSGRSYVCVLLWLKIAVVRVKQYFH